MPTFYRGVLIPGYFLHFNNQELYHAWNERRPSVPLDERYAGMSRRQIFLCVSFTRTIAYMTLSNEGKVKIKLYGGKIKINNENSNF